MPVRFTEYTAEHTTAVHAFNARLRAGGMTMQYPTQVIPSWLPPAEGRPLYQEQFVAVDENSEVRGGYILKHQIFKIGDAIIPIADLRLPISEGAVDRKHAAVASELLFSALRKQRLLFGMGIGGYDEAVAKLFKAAGWRIFTVPFFFKVLRPFRFCRKIRFLRQSWHRRAALDLSAWSGAAWIGMHGLQTRPVRDRHNTGVRVEVVEEFDAWTDEIWERCRSEYGMIAVRDREVLQMLYPKCDLRFLRLKFSSPDGPSGWAVLLDTQMKDHRQFGTLRVGSFVDGLASTDAASSVVHAATKHLKQRGVDLIVSNQSHAAWCDAFWRSGFLRGPSNCLFAGSRGLNKLLGHAEIESDQFFINRGDGDGPINL